jgi:teichuronic acid biosynthesis glycosyltransferase TuaH
MELQKQDIVCISNTSWFGKYAKSTVMLLERIAVYNRVVFVEHHYTWADVWYTLRGRRQAPIAQMLGLKPRLQAITSSVGSQVYKLVMPPSLPVFFLKNEQQFERLFGINTSVYSRILKKKLSKLGMDNPLVVTAYNPFYGLAMLRKLNEKAHIYYCYDGVEPSYYGQRIFRYEEDFSRQADAIICSSDYLGANKQSLNARIYVVKNGVNFPLFSCQAKTEPYKRKRRKVGFIGSLDPRFDIDTVEYAVQQLTDYDFEFTGDMRNEHMRNRLKDYANVSFFDAVKPEQVPALLNRYDVGIIPYLINEVNRNIYPLKINEFLAVGVPVVMNNFANLPEFEGMVTTVTSKEAFVEGLLQACQQDTAERISQRIAFAKGNSWDERAEDFANILAQYTKS